MGHLQLTAGTVFAHRFEIDRPQGAGGMGTIYRAYDRQRCEVVALKLLHKETSSQVETTRFAREAQILAELRHPAIVSYVAHGQTPDGQQFLAMEWLDGCDLSQHLAQRLARGPLPLQDALLVVQRAAEALNVAHQRGILHRDLKPTNLFLPGEEIARCKLLDFGIARVLTASAVTRTGMVVGTPDYMSPEQARGVRDLTPATDIFSLGCVLYECLSGARPFVGEHVAALLVRILYEEPAPIATRRPGIPPALVALLADMLNKNGEQRIADAAALLQRLAELGEVTEPALPSSPAAQDKPPSAFAENEQLLFSLVIAAEPRRWATTPAVTHVQKDAAHRESLILAVRTLGARAEYLVDGALVVTVPQIGSAPDQVALAARAALLIKERWPEATVAVTTGRGTAQGTTAVGEVSDRAVRILKQRTGEQLAAPADSGVWLDELSVRLLDPRFTVSRRAESALLLGEDKEVDASRPLLGKPTPCVGRDSELGSLEARLTSCIMESAACAVLVSALPGIGKSRLRHEFLRQVEKRRDPVTVLQGRGDMARAGTPYGILGAAIRQLCHVTEGEPLATQRQHLRARIAQHVAVTDQERVVLFVGELCNLPFSDAGQPVLQAARREPKVMWDCLRRAAVDWLRAECAAAPVLLVLDDLQWGDTLTVSLLDEALQELHEAPLMVLALARPEVQQTFPGLWQNRKLQQISLRALNKRACERLIQQVLGKDVAVAALAHAVEQSAGNVLFLEELIRAIADGSWNTQNATLVAMVQARLGRLDVSARRAVRAAAVFGQTFWCGGVTAILQSAQASAEPENWLTALVDAELVQKQLTSRIAGDTEYRFRHALVRDAVYDLLTTSDLQIGHRIAAEFLASATEPDAAVIAKHFAHSGDLQRAVHFYEQAADQALACYDLGRALAQAQRGIDCQAEGESRGRLWGILCIANIWRFNWPAALTCGEAALALLPPQSRRYIETASALLFAIHSGGIIPKSPSTEQIVATLLQASPTPDTRAPLAEAAAWLCSTAAYTTQHQLVDISYERLVALCTGAAADDLSVQRWLSWGTCNYLYFRQPLPWTLYTTAQRGEQQFQQVGNSFQRQLIQLFLPFHLSELGERAEGEKLLTAQWVKLRNSTDPMFRGLAAQLLGTLLFRSLHPAEQQRLQLAREVAQELLEKFAQNPDSVSFGSMIKASVHSCEGRPEHALADARRGYAMLPPGGPCQRMAAAGLLRLLVEHSQLAEARTTALQELGHLREHSDSRVFALQVRSECVSALYRSGDTERAQEELQAVLAQLRLRVADVPAGARRTTYLTNNLDCLLIRQLTVALLGVDPISDLQALCSAAA